MGSSGTRCSFFLPSVSCGDGFVAVPRRVLCGPEVLSAEPQVDGEGEEGEQGTELGLGEEMDLGDGLG